MIKCKKCGEKYVSAHKIRLPRSITQTGGNSEEVNDIEDCHACRPPKEKDES